MEDSKKPKLDLKNLNFKFDFKKIKTKLLPAKNAGSEVREINLVPDIKYEIIKVRIYSHCIFFHFLFLSFL